MWINGTLRFPPGDAIDVAMVHITLRDITELDGPAAVVASVELPSLAVPANGLELPFALEADVGDPRRMYSVRAHADRSGTGAVEPGDLVTTTAHLVGAHLVGADKEDTPVLELQPVTG